MLKTRLATNHDLKDILEAIHDSARFLKQNKIPQWQSMNCPNEDLIKSDIENKHGYVLLMNDVVCGYAAFSDTNEKVYDDLYRSLNITSEKYIVIHRIASKDSIRGQGLISTFLKLVMRDLSVKINDFRIDTHPLNLFMQKVLKNLDFKYIGDVTLPISDGFRHTYRLLF